MRTFTPGPSTVRVEYPYEKQPRTPYCYIDAGDGFLDVRTNTGFHIQAIITPDDAHLLAHAEPLLRALKAMVDLWTEQHGAELCNHRIDLDSPCLCELCTARALIAEIEGPPDVPVDPEVELAAAIAWGDGP